MFKENDIVRVITEDGTGEVMRVLESYDEGINAGTSHCAVGNDDHSTWVDSLDLELVTDDQEIHMDLKPMIANEPTITNEQVHEEICKIFGTVVQWIRANGEDARIRLSINTEHYSSDNISVNFEAQLAYGDTVTSDNLFESAKVALKRKREDELLKPLSIPFYKEDEA